MIKIKINLNSGIWKTAARRKALDDAVLASAGELQGAIQKNIDDSVPAGRVYRVGTLTKAATKPLLALGLKTRKGNAKRVITGSRIHRASAPGQPPAVDTTNLLNSIRAAKTGEMRATVAAGAEYAAALENGATIPGRNKRSNPSRVKGKKTAGPLKNIVIKPRPFFKPVVEKFAPKFKENIRKAIDDLK